MQKQRILFLHLGQAFGGIEVYMSNLARLLRDDAEIIVWCSHPRLIELLAADGVQIVRMPEVHGPLRGLRFVFATLLLPYVLLRYRIDTVHVNGHWESVLLLPCRLLGCRTISTRHQTWDLPLEHWWHAPKRTLASIVYGINARFADKVICVSQTVATEIAQQLAIDKIVVIPNWISVQPPFSIKPTHSGKVRVLFVGRMVIFKGLHLLIEAVRGLTNISVTAVGEGAMLEDFQDQAKGLDISFAGFQRDIIPYYRDADILVMPSIGLEGLPLVSLEAMAHGVPCLFSDLPVHREITGNGRSALLFRTNDSQDLRTKLDMLARDEMARAKFALAGYENIQARYTAQAARQSYLDAFALNYINGSYPEGARG